jgi:hypothetical protein
MHEKNIGLMRAQSARIGELILLYTKPPVKIHKKLRGLAMFFEQAEGAGLKGADITKAISKARGRK